MAALADGMVSRRLRHERHFLAAMSLFVRHVFHEPNLTNLCGAVGPVLIIVGVTRFVLEMGRR